LKLGFLARWCACACCHFPCGKITAHWQITVLLPYFLPQNSLDYNTWGILWAMGNSMAHLKRGSLERAIWQLQSAKFEQYFAPKLPHKQAMLGEGRHCQQQL
jgi:hypothetical protein